MLANIYFGVLQIIRTHIVDRILQKKRYEDEKSTGGRPSSILEMYVMVSTIIFAIMEVANGVEWDCAASTNTGTFTRSSDCTISGTGNTNDQGGGVDVTGTLEIVGSSTDMDNLVRISLQARSATFT